MNLGQTVFSQLLDLIPQHEFRKCVRRYRGNYKVKCFSCMDQFLCMTFAQLAYRGSLRDIEACLRSGQAKLYHMGIRGRVSRSTLARANQRRDWRIYRDFGQVLIAQARALYVDEPFGVDWDQTVYALDATTIDLCLSLFPWAKFSQGQAAVKMHTLLDLRGSIPACVFVTSGKTHEVNLLDRLLLEPGSICVMDRGYLDYARLFAIHQAGAFFVIRAKKNTQFRRLSSTPIDTSTGLRSDHAGVFAGRRASRDYPDRLRRVRFYDRDKKKSLVFLTNLFHAPALTIAELYRCRWQVELFFRWVKQHLRIEAFYGTSENAVKTQIWIALSAYVLVAILKKTLHIDRSLYTILQILSVNLFVKSPILQVLSNAECPTEDSQLDYQLKLFNL